MKKINKTFIFFTIMILVILGSLGLYYSKVPPYSNDLKWTQEYIIGAEGIKGAVDTTQFGDSDAYAMGANKYGYAVFKNPDKAFNQMKKDYKNGIAAIKDEFKLTKLSKINFKHYMTYGWQLSDKNTDKEQKEARMVTNFLDIYENSFSETTIFNWFFK